jgi:hypothetical protein
LRALCSLLFVAGALEGTLPRSPTLRAIRSGLAFTGRQPVILAGFASTPTTP